MARVAPRRFALGLQFSTDSVHALIVDVSTGAEAGIAVSRYPSGEDGVLLDEHDPHLARQNPADYTRCLLKAVKAAIKSAEAHEHFDPAHLIGIGVCATGSTPLPVDQEGAPLALRDEFKDDPAAQAWLWNDGTAEEEATEITSKVHDAKKPYLAKYGGSYPSQWYWSKILHCKRYAPRVFRAAYSWVELADFIPAYLTGNASPDTMPRSISAAGHKAMWNEQWGGLPEKGFLASLAPELATLRDHYAAQAWPSDRMAGRLTEAVAKKLGLPPGIPVAVGAIDAHMGAVGAGIKPGTLVKILGGSACDAMVWPLDRKLADIPGLCGIVPHSIVPEMHGMEAGQAAVGDVLDWFVRELAPAPYTRKGDAHANLIHDAEQLAPGESGLLALDWHNGNRTVLVDPQLTGLLVGQTLHTNAPEIYRALLEAIAFGALTIIRRFESYQVPVKDVILCGPMAEENPFVVQICADVCNRPMKVSRSAQACALGAAAFGAVVGGAYKNVEAAQKKMAGVREKVFKPRKSAVAVYEQLYQLYEALHDAFGTPDFKGQVHRVMKDLIRLRTAARQAG
jgi:L-ribulokinase